MASRFLIPLIVVVVGTPTCWDAMPQAAAQQPAAKPPETLQHHLEVRGRAVKRISAFLKSVGDPAMAAKVENAYYKGWVKFGPVERNDNAQISPLGYITLNEKFLAILGAAEKDSRESYRQAGNAVQSLVHEFQHESQWRILGVTPVKVGSSWGEGLWGSKYETQAYHTALCETTQWLNRLREQYRANPTQQLAEQIADVCGIWQAYNNDIKSLTFNVGADRNKWLLQNTMIFQSPDGKRLTREEAERQVAGIGRQAETAVAVHELLKENSSDDRPLNERIALIRVDSEQALKDLLEKNAESAVARIYGAGVTPEFFAGKARQLQAAGTQSILELWRKRQEVREARFTALLNELRKSKLTLSYAPDPAQLAVPDYKVRVTVATHDDAQRKLLDNLRTIADRFTAQEVTVNVSYRWSDGQAGKTAVYEYVAPNAYPVSVRATFVVQTGGKPIGGAARHSVDIDSQPLEVVVVGPQYPASLAGRWTGRAGVASIPGLDDLPVAGAEGMTVRLGQMVAKLKAEGLDIVCTLVPATENQGRFTIKITPPIGMGDPASQTVTSTYNFVDGVLTVSLTQDDLNVRLKGRVMPAVTGWKLDGTWTSTVNRDGQRLESARGSWSAINRDAR
jgi:hypothetical protein